MRGGLPRVNKQAKENKMYIVTKTLGQTCSPASIIVQKRGHIYLSICLASRQFFIYLAETHKWWRPQCIPSPCVNPSLFTCLKWTTLHVLSSIYALADFLLFVLGFWSFLILYFVSSYLYLMTCFFM